VKLNPFTDPPRFCGYWHLKGGERYWRAERVWNSSAIV